MLNPETVRAMARRGEIPAMKVGRSRGSPYRFRRSSIDAWLDAAEKKNERRAKGWR